jgi:Ca2+-binding EF-hand superfamily protein
MDVTNIGLNALCGQYGANGLRPLGDLDEATSRLIRDKDKDGNGTLNAVEISISEEGFKQADANKDGQLDADELKNSFGAIAAELMAQKPPAPPSLDEATERLIQDLDEDGDGSLNAEEISISSKLFEEADANGDGVLSFDELKTASKAIGEELRTDQAPGRPNLIEQLFSSKSDDDDTETLNQIL